MQVQSVVGVKCNNPYLPGRLYLAENGGLTKRIQAAKFFDKVETDTALEEVKAYSTTAFAVEVKAVDELF